MAAAVAAVEALVAGGQTGHQCAGGQLVLWLGPGERDCAQRRAPSVRAAAAEAVVPASDRHGWEPAPRTGTVCSVPPASSSVDCSRASSAAQTAADAVHGAQ